MQIWKTSSTGTSADIQSADELRLVDKMRPTTLDEFVGQDHLIGEAGILRGLLEADQITSMILYGPPGSGKTSLAEVMAAQTGGEVFTHNPVLWDNKDFELMLKKGALCNSLNKRRSVILIDPIHRLEPARQDLLLAYIETGELIFIGCTTEDPALAIKPALRSRVMIFPLNPLSAGHLRVILWRAVHDIKRGLTGIEADDTVLRRLAAMANGDARVALNLLETAARLADAGANHVRTISHKTVEALLQEAPTKEAPIYAPSDLAAALLLCLEHSDTDAALYWLGRTIEAGEDLQDLARRLVEFASEHIGLADPQALHVALSVAGALRLLSRDKGKLALAQAVTYLSAAPKSKAVAQAYRAAEADVQSTRREAMPVHTRNALRWNGAQDAPVAEPYRDGVAYRSNLPEVLQEKKYYHPTEQGVEKTIKEHLQRIAEHKLAKKNEEEQKVMTGTGDMETDWNRRALQNARKYIACSSHETEEDFVRSGRQALNDFVLYGIEPSPQATILEIGCGLGRLLQPLAAQVKEAHGVDVSSEMVAQAKDRLKEFDNIFVSKTDGSNLNGQPSAYFDLVYSYLVFQHIPKKEYVHSYIREAHRVLKPGGLFRFQVDGRCDQTARREQAGTWDGVVFEKAEIVDFLRTVGFDVLDSSGARSQYFWITAQAAGAPEVDVFARFVRKPWNKEVLTVFFNKLAPGRSAELEQQLEAGLINMDDLVLEFCQTRAQLRAEEFIKEVYDLFANRPPDPYGLASYMDELNKGTLRRIEIASAFSICSEFRNLHFLE